MLTCGGGPTDQVLLLQLEHDLLAQGFHADLGRWASRRLILLQPGNHLHCSGAECQPWEVCGLCMYTAPGNWGSVWVALTAVTADL